MTKPNQLNCHSGKSPHGFSYLKKSDVQLQLVKTDFQKCRIENEIRGTFLVDSDASQIFAE